MRVLYFFNKDMWLHGMKNVTFGGNSPWDHVGHRGDDKEDVVAGGNCSIDGDLFVQVGACKAKFFSVSSKTQDQNA
jgi:hypothetical protein